MGISCKAVVVMQEVVNVDSGQWRDSGCEREGQS